MTPTQPPGLERSPPSADTDRARAPLANLHRLLLSPAGSTDRTAVLAGLARAFGARGAGVAVFLEGQEALKDRVWSDRAVTAEGPWPWEAAPDLLPLSGAVPGPREVHKTDVGWLAVAAERTGGVGWLLWLEDGPERAWDAGERAALTLAGQILPDRIGTEAERAAWGAWAEQQRLQRRLEDVAVVTGRLAHDFGNVLTAVCGFGELALMQLPPAAPAHKYVQELALAAQRGQEFIQRLFLFSRRRSAPRSSVLRAAVAEEAARARQNWPAGVTLQLDLPGDLPPVALDAEPLRQILGQLLANAREAIPGPGKVTLRARAVELTATDCLGLWGKAVPGPHLEVTVADTGTGLGPDVRRRLLRDLFFTTKTGHRGLGLAGVYGLLQANRGGFQIAPGPGGGTEVRVALPVAAGGTAALARPRPRQVPTEPGPAVCASPRP